MSGSGRDAVARLRRIRYIFFCTPAEPLLACLIPVGFLFLGLGGRVRNTKIIKEHRMDSRLADCYG